jgi:tetratricopeptide (TPR) repeat protein
MLLALACAGAPVVHAQGQGPLAPPPVAGPGFRAVHYDLTATLTPATQVLTARATVTFEATEASHVIAAELHPNLQILSLTDAAGRAVTFDRSGLEVTINLAQAIPRGQKVTLNFDYSGPLANEENSPAPGVRLASISTDGAYLLLPARWFPLTDFPENRFTAVFKLQVPDNFVVAGTGTRGPVQEVSGQAAMPEVVRPGAPPPAPIGQKLYTFRVEKPQPAGTFVANVLQEHDVNAGALKIPVYATAASAQTSQLYGEAVARILEEFSSVLGPDSNPNLTLAEMPDGSLSGFAGPGLVLISQRQWDPKVNTQLLSRFVAAQWFGNDVLPASAADAWVTDGLAHYCEALYAEELGGKQSADKVVEEFTVGALMYDDVAPITQANQLKPYTNQYASIVVDKGAAVFAMLRSVLGDESFRSLLREFYEKYAGKTARNTDLEQLAQQHYAARHGASAANDTGSMPSLTPFFAQWLDSTGAPAFALEYTIFRTPKGFRITGKIKQDIETFNMPVELEILTEGNPEFKTIQVVGTETSFDVETFGRPKENGILLDPHNYILKSSGSMKVRATIARGETFAEQGHFLEAIEQYQKALDQEPNNGLALFRMGEAFFYQKNYSAAANSFRGAIGGINDLNSKWVEVWSHIYIGKIFDLTGQRDRAVNEYNQALHMKDNTGGAQEEAQKLLSQPYKEGT